MSSKSWASLAPVFAAILILLAFLVFLLVYDDLNSKLWVQGLVGIVIALVVSVVLFSIIYSSVHVKGAALWGGVLGMSGGALFYLILLPYLKPFIFTSHSVTGFVYYKRGAPDAPLKAVQGVVAQIPETGQKSAPSDQQGRFVIDSVYSENTKLLFQYAGDTFPANTADYKDSIYAIIPLPVKEPPPERKSIDASQWQEGNPKECPRDQVGAYATVKEFALNQTIAKDAAAKAAGATRLTLKVSLPADKGDIFDAEETEPGTGLEIQEQGSSDLRTRSWQWQKITGDQLKIRIVICLGTKGGQGEPSSGNLETAYWFGQWR